MRAIKLVAPGELELVEVPIPVPGPHQVLVKVGGAGICGTDIHLLHSGALWQHTGITLGHEGAGWVAEVGGGVAQFVPGDPVLVQPIAGCGICRCCRAGQENACRNEGGRLGQPATAGLTYDGCMADYVLLPQRSLIPIPGLDVPSAAPLGDAAATTMHAINSIGHSIYDPVVALIGFGGMGQYALQTLKAVSRATVIVIEINEARLEAAKAQGADYVFFPTDAAIAEILAIRDNMGADVVLDFVGNQQCLDFALKIIAPSGALRIIGLNGGKFTYQAAMTSASNPLPWGVNIQRCFGGSHRDIQEVVSLALAGKINIDVTKYPLTDFLQAFSDLNSGHVPGRAILIP